MKASTTPITVPKSPTNGLVAAMVASHVMRRSEAGDCLAGRGLAGALQRNKIARRSGAAGLALVGLVNVLEDLRQRAGLAVVGEACDLLQARGLAKGADEAAAFPVARYGRSKILPRIMVHE